MLGAEQVEHKVTRVDIRDDQLTHWNFLAACQAHGRGAFCVAQNLLDADVRADFAAMRLQIFGESERDPVHPAFDEIIADILQDRSKQPAELGTTGVVRRRAEKSGERAEQCFGRFCFQRLVRPRSDTLHAEPISLHTRRGGGEVCRRCRERRRRRKHARGDGVLLREEAVHQGLAMSRHPSGVAGDVRDSFFNVAMDADDVAVGECVREGNFRFDEFIAVEQTAVRAGQARGLPIDSRWRECPTKSPGGFLLR